ncbi:pyridoxamine 5'-phosphate oxidase-related FMN-binding [Methylobacterium sp. 4-46]|uniref:pyridoxamine 5'-phosphate oxidase family protein n=1 Tax=unclassified Methylobacterium TaxID=2615210 RepID=UPI000152CE05|nr:MULTISPECIES: pyridoxamine 5'-phosphate oxidase family protein [Methylobacterium]ACA16022.1 pyridoxamine 5'-phosphate oxidase-related FMN-binding [Methylobacterium sp. 4-46]WFT81733.1 pyridoxamine 5'-phosphate oxidase family protein [Methylobacterium nodulans]
MRRRFFDLAFTPSVQAEQTRRGSRAAYASAAGGARAEADVLTDLEAAFIAERDSFYLASVSETGWPYVQHRGGPAGFVRRLDARTIGWAEFAGNRQYVSAGNTAADDRVSLFFMDYPHRRRLKLLGHLRAHEPDERPDLAERLAVPGYRARVEGLVTVAVEAFDWNCPQHITPRFTAAEIEAAVAPLHARIAELEARLGARAPQTAG